MKRRWVLLAAVGTGTVSGLALLSQGCTSTTCEEELNCPPGKTGEGGSEGGADRFTTDSHGDRIGHDGPSMKDAGDSGEGGPTCKSGAPPADNGCIPTMGAIFVATMASGGSDTTGTGTMTTPYATVSNALKNLGTSTAIYVCGGNYSDQIPVSVPVSIYGGLTCSGGSWKYSASAVGVVKGSSGPAPFRGQFDYAASYSRSFFSSMNFISNSVGVM
jgi:hypothetical protein